MFTRTLITVALTTPQTEYSLALPTVTRRLRIFPSVNIRMAFAASEVNLDNGDYDRLNANREYDSGEINGAGTVYLSAERYPAVELPMEVYT